MIVCKFGGKSTTKSEALENIKNLAKNKNRQIFVFSAMGKCDDKDIKLTDLLIDMTKSEQSFNLGMRKLKNKLKYLCNLAKIKININYYLRKIKLNYLKTKNKEYLISRGEYLTSIIMSKYLKIKYVDAKKIIYFKNNEINYQKINEKTQYYLKKYKKFVTSGFYGIDENKKIILFPRGGGDITGAVLSKVTNAKIYENWTDTNGLKMVNPEIVLEGKQIKKISYKDADVMTSCDANVLHNDVCKILGNTKTITKIGNIFCPKVSPTILDNHNHKCNFVCYKKINDYVQVVVKTNSVDILRKFFDLINYINKSYVYLCTDNNNYKKIIRDIYKVIEKQ